MNNTVLLIIIPLLAAFLVPLFGKAGKYGARTFTSLVFLGTAVYALLTLLGLKEPQVILLGGWKPPFGIHLYLDSFSALIVAAIYLLAFLSMFFMDKKFAEHPKFYVLLLIIVAGATGMVMTGDIFNLFVFMEITGIAAASLIAYGNLKSGLTGSLKYILTASMGTLLMLAGIGLIYHLTGSLNLPVIAEKFQAIPANTRTLATVLLLTGLFVEAKIFPLNMWVPSSYKGAPVVINVMLSAVVALAAGTVFMRLSILSGQTANMPAILMWAGVVTTVIGEISAFTEKDLKKLLAYSSVGQMGLVLFAIGLMSTGGFYGGLFTLLSHSVVKVLLFLLAGHMILEAGSSRLESLAGYGKNHPYLAVLFTIGALSLTGLPGFMGFWGKFSIVGAAVGSTQILPVIFILLVSIAEGVYLLRVSFTLFSKPDDMVQPKVKINPLLFIVVSLLAALILVIGVYPGLISGLIDKATDAIMNTNLYMNSIWN